jgi:hypothetical protein
MAISTCHSDSRSPEDWRDSSGAARFARDDARLDADRQYVRTDKGKAKPPVSNDAETGPSVTMKVQETVKLARGNDAAAPLSA